MIVVEHDLSGGWTCWQAIIEWVWLQCMLLLCVLLLQSLQCGLLLCCLLTHPSRSLPRPAVLDYLSDFICCLYGKPGAYGEC